MEDASTATKGDEEEPPAESLKDWLKDFEESTGGNMVDLNRVPSFNLPLANLIREATRSPIEFTEILCTEAHIHSCEKFVSCLGGAPTHIFEVFGAPLIDKHPLSFLRSWMLAQHLRLHPLIDEKEGDVFDLSLFDSTHGEDRWNLNRRKMSAEFKVQFGLTRAHCANLKKQLDSNVSQVTSKEGNAR